VQLARKATYRQYLAKLHIPYRLTDRAELDALKSAGHISTQAPSSMLMRLEDAVKLMKAKGVESVRKILQQQVANDRKKRSHQPRAPSPPHSSTIAPVPQSALSHTFLLDPTSKVEVSEKAERDARECEDEDYDDDEVSSASEVSVVSPDQFRLMWQRVTPSAPFPAPKPSTPPRIPLPPPRNCSEAQLRKPRKPSSPFSLSHQLALEWQQRERMQMEEKETMRVWSECDYVVGYEWQRRKRQFTEI
jgi:hypothetical protein